MKNKVSNICLYLVCFLVITKINTKKKFSYMEMIKALVLVHIPTITA